MTTMMRWYVLRDRQGMRAWIQSPRGMRRPARILACGLEYILFYLIGLAILSCVLLLGAAAWLLRLE